MSLKPNCLLKYHIALQNDLTTWGIKQLDR